MKANNNKNIISVVIAIAIVLALGYYLYRAIALSDNPDAVTPLSSATTTTETLNNDLSVIESGENIATEASLPTMPIPDLDREVRPPEAMQKDIADALVRQVAEIITSLKRNPDDIAGWSDLGMVRKSLGDYEGTRQAWEYAAALRPNDYLAFVNLGDLYGYYLKDNAQAEKNFKHAIVNDPTRVYLYFKTYEFYRDIGEPNKARVVVERGVAANPDSAELRNLLGSIK